MISKNRIISQNHKFTTRTIKLKKHIQESNPKNEVFTSIYNNRVLTKEGNLFKENLPKNASESTIEATDRRGLRHSILNFIFCIFIY